MINCCKGCSERYLGCHDRCRIYAKQKAKWEKEKQKKREECYNFYGYDTGWSYHKRK